MFENLEIIKECKDELEEAVLKDRLSHAVILQGADEQTRLKAAKELARALICTGENKPCGKCPNCVKMLAESHGDVHILQKDEKSSTIKVDEIRLLKKQASLFPNEARLSIFIVSEAQLMGVAAQNALLKIFEEPSDHVKFILTCDSKDAMLETIISRASIYTLANPASDSALQENEKAFELACELVKALCKGNEFDFLALTGIFQKDKELFSSCVKIMIDIFADALVLSSGSVKTHGTAKDEARLLSGAFTAERMIRIVEFLQSELSDIKANANFNLVLTRLCSNLYSIKTN